MFSEEQLTRFLSAVTKGSHKTVALQFPDHLLPHSSIIQTHLEDRSDAQVFILADTSFSACCVDFIAAKHIDATLVIHFGPACHASHDSQVEVLYEDAVEHPGLRYADVEAAVSGLIGEHSGAKTLLVFDHAYYHHLNVGHRAPNPLKKYHVLTPDTAGESSMWGFAIPHDILAYEQVCFVGSPGSLLWNVRLFFHQKDVFAFSFDLGSFQALQRKDSNKILSQRYATIERVGDLQSVGIVVTNLASKWTQECLSLIQAMCRSCGVDSYVFSLGKLTEAKLANFPEIECFVFVSCYATLVTEISFSHIPLLSLYEFVCMLNRRPMDIFSESYIYDIAYIMCSGLLTRQSSHSNTLEMAANSNQSLTAVSRFKAKTFQGLNLGLDERDLGIHAGLDGIASSYQSDRDNKN